MNQLSMLKLGFACLALSLAACGGSDKDPDLGDGAPPDTEDAGQGDGDLPSDDAGGGDAAGDGGGNENDGGAGEDGGDASRCLTACAGDDCGEVPTGCDGFLSCGQCGAGLICGQNAPNKCAAPPPVVCTPKTPAEVCPNKCGAVSDGCSGVIVCGADNGGAVCSVGQTCMNSTCTDNGATCTPTTCEAKNHDCGQDGDGCGGVLDCGQCGAGERCQFASSGNTCEIIPPVVCTTLLTPAEACMNTCGVVGDGCGSTINCELTPFACPGGQTCGGGGVPGQCGSGTQVCVPTAEATVCAGKCGTQSNGCEGTYNCNASNGGQVCNAAQGESCGGGGTPNVCGKPPCPAKTQGELCPATGVNKSCGKQSDGCGGLVDCGGCAQDQLCGLNNIESICGTIPVCQPIAVATACSQKCGTVPDGCGGSYNCSGSNGGVSCTGNEYCGANGQANKCGAPPVSCVPKTCAELGHSCGLASDGCGHILNCWSTCPVNNPSCNGACTGNASCLANQATGAQSCVVGAPTCTGSLCSTVPTTCAANAPTRLTGTVVTPGRLVNGSYINRLPVPNAMVYIPAEPNTALPSITTGVTVGNSASCGRCEDELFVATGESVLAAAITDYKGAFTLEGRIPVGTAFKLVIKIGKWRRVVQIPSGTSAACATRALTTEMTRLNANSTDGLIGTQLPKIAVSTGSVDEMECVFRNIGIAESEFTLPTNSGRIHMYRSNGAMMTGATCSGTYTNNGNTIQCTANSNAGCVNRNTGCSFSNNDSLLYSNQTTINGYDLVVWDCEGAEEQHNTHDAKIETYVNNGGRMFASHFSYSWIEGNGTLDQSADWGVAGTYDTGTGFISLPTGNTARTRANGVKSLLFRDWLDYQGALTGTTAGQLSNPPQATPQFTISEPRDRAGPNVGAASDEWVYRNARLCSNSASRVCTQNSDCNVCSNNSNRACSQNNDCQNNGTCVAGGTCGTTENPRVQQLSFNTPYNANEDAICGRVAYSGFHVAATDNNDNNDFFPGVCSNGALSAQEKILVFMLFDLATCVSSGDPPQPPSCTPKTVANTCPSVNDACGYISDGCGGVVDCAGCAAGFYCDGNTCRPQQCTPSTCTSLGFTCGQHADGCGGIARNSQGVEGCGVCTGGQICGLNTPGICGGCVQIPKSTACPANSCGQVSDGCGGIHDCGVCPSGVCGGAGANRCGPGTCTPIPQATACMSKNCGVVSDGCGGTYTCGVCTAPDTCGGGGAPNVCGHPVCTPKTIAEACNGLSCGYVSDGCGGAINCGTCPNGGVCGGNGPNKCGSTCTPTTCTAAGAECGAISDQCGNILSCGNCPAGQTCGAAGPNKCGSGPSCTPRTCTAAGAECGLVGDGCGGILDCGVCVAPESCGGAGQANQCGTGTGGCNPLTCSGQSVQCGQATDGCGGLLDCGNCPSGYACERGACVYVPIYL